MQNQKQKQNIIPDVLAESFSVTVVQNVALTWVWHFFVFLLIPVDTDDQVICSPGTASSRNQMNTLTTIVHVGPLQTKLIIN